MVEGYSCCMVMYACGECIGSLEYFIDDMVQICIWLMIWYMAQVVHG
jgi:hypothetical protein